jgi:iron complex outermembrane receptor protein
MTRRGKSALRGLLLSSAVGSIMSPAWADLDMTAGGPDEVIVTGQRSDIGSTGTKSDAPLIETPMSISVIDKSQIDELGLQSVAQALRYTAGVSPETRGGVVTRYDMFNLRGFAVNSPFYNGLGTMNDGWYAVAQPDVSTLDRIEVLKGPASVLYGNTPPGGLVNLVAKTPVENQTNSLEISGGSFYDKQGQLDVGGAIGDSLLYRVEAMGRQGDGQAVTTKNERYALAPSVTWKVDSDTSITLLGLLQRDPKSDAYGAVPAQGSVLSNPFGKLATDFYDGDTNYEKFDRTQVMAGYEASHRFNDIFSVQQNFRWQQVGINYESVYSYGLESDNRTLTRYSIYSNERTRGLDVDTQGKADFMTGPISHHVLVGVDYQRADSNIEVGYGGAPSLDIVNPDYSLPIPAADMPVPAYQMTETPEQTGVYVQDQIKWDRFVLLLGERKDWYNQTTTDAIAQSVDVISQQHFSGRAGLLYHFDSGFAPYVSYSQSFEPQDGVSFTGTPFVPTTGEQYEAGLKYETPSQQTLVTLAGFNITRDHLLTVDPLHENFSVQTGAARSRGVELEGKVQVNDWLNLSGQYTHLDVKFTEDNSGLVGKAPVGIPADTASAWAETKPFEGFGIGGGVRYLGKSWGDSDNSFQVDDATLFDLATHYDLGRLSSSLTGARLSVSVTNLLDKRYVSSCYSAEWCWFGSERTVQAALKYSW